MPPISQDMGRTAVDEPKKGSAVLFGFCQKRRESRSFLLQYRWLPGDEKGVEVMCNIKSPRLSSGSSASGCENLSSLRAKVPWSWSFQLHHYYTHDTQSHLRNVKTRSARKGV